MNSEPKRPQHQAKENCCRPASGARSHSAEKKAKLIQTLAIAIARTWSQGLSRLVVDLLTTPLRTSIFIILPV